jgi:cytochrome P450
MPKAFEEMLRYNTPVCLDSRTALEDVEIAGVTIRRGQTVSLSLAAANRDPAVYADPDGFLTERERTRLVSFGGGLHRCAGAALAQIEAEVGFTMLVTAFPGLTLPDAMSPHWRKSVGLRGLVTLPARW